MPFYRSVLESAGGGGGGGGGDTKSPYVNLTTDGEYPYVENFQYNLSMSFDEDIEAISKVEIGNKIISVGNLFSGNYYYPYTSLTKFNAPVDLKNARALQNMSYMVNGCENFNSTVIFPERIDDPQGDIDAYFGCCQTFYGCTNYNQPTAIRFHDYSSNKDNYSQINMSYMFYNCRNLNSQVLFDFYKANKNIEYEYDSYFSIHYDCNNIFNNCESFNQPLIFPPLMSNFWNYSFSNCNSFNQPIVFDLFGCDTYGVNFYGVFGWLPNMASDIIFLNSNQNFNKYYFELLLNTSRTKMTNIYIENVFSTNILNDRVVMSGPNNIDNYTVSSSPYNAECNVYTNTTYKITISEDVQHGLNEFNNYYYNFYGEYPVIQNLIAEAQEAEETQE